MSTHVPSIPEAYCHEIGKVMDIEFMRMRFMDVGIQKKFTFCCPNEACRKLVSPPVIDAVNLFEKTYKKAPHFRWRDRSWVHAPGCLAMEYEAIREEVVLNTVVSDDYVRNSKLNAFKHYNNLVPGEVVDELFVSHNVKAERPTCDVNYSSRHDIRRAIAHHHSRKTSFLSVVVDQFRKMTDHEKRYSRIVIRDEGHNVAMSWREAFLPIQFIKHDSGLRIFFGLATCYRYNDAFRFFFKSKCYAFDKYNRDVDCIAIVAHNSISKSDMERDTFKLLYEHGKSIVCCYIVCKAQRRSVALPGRDAKDFIVLEYASLRHIVMRDNLPHDPDKMSCEMNCRA